ncbi:MAG: carboxypeptidase regulatory-like domain-containing protein, partial [bacterium]
MRGFARSLAVIGVALAALSCSEAPSSSAASGKGRIALAPSFSPAAARAYQALAAFGLEVTGVHVHLTAPDGSTRDTTIAFPLELDVLEIQMAVPLRSAGETFTADLDLTNSDGVVLFSGRQTVVAQAADLPGGSAPATVTITYTGPGHDLKSIAVSPPSQSVIGATSVAVSANGVDNSGLADPNVLVRWTSSDGSIASVASTGNATASVTTTGKRGTATISAITALGITGTGTVTAVPPPAKVVVISGGSQTGPAGVPLSAPLVVEVQGADNLPVGGAPVAFRAVTAGATVGTTSTVSDGSGRASSVLTPGPTPGTYQFEASSGTLAPVGVSVTATAAPASVLIAVSGGNQSGPVGTALAQPFVVKVTNATGGIVGGATVQWSRVSGAGTLGGPTSVSAADGTARMTYTLGTANVPEVVRASLAGVPAGTADFTVFAAAGPAVDIVGTGSGQHAPAGTALPSQLSARVVDAFNNGVSGATVAWSVTSGPTATFSPSSSTTDANGFALTTVTLGGTPGALTIAATSGALTRTFAATADQGSTGPAGPGTLSGFVYDAVSGGPLSGVSVVIQQGGQTVMTAQTSGTGNFSTTQLPAGTYDLQFSISGYVSTTINALTINGNTVAQVVPLVPASTSLGGIAGTVFDATTNQAVQGSLTLELRSGVNATTGTPLQSVTSTNGGYLFSSVPAGTYTIVAKVSGYADATATGIAVGAATTSNQNIYISPAGVAGLVRIVLTWRSSPRAACRGTARRGR